MLYLLLLRYKFLLKRYIEFKYSKRPSITTLEKFLTNLEKPLILVLDEIDHLCGSSNSLLYAAFKWPQQFNSKLIVLGDIM